MKRKISKKSSLNNFSFKKTCWDGKSSAKIFGPAKKEEHYNTEKRREYYQ